MEFQKLTIENSFSWQTDLLELVVDGLLCEGGSGDRRNFPGSEDAALHQELGYILSVLLPFHPHQPSSARELTEELHHQGVRGISHHSLEANDLVLRVLSVFGCNASQTDLKKSQDYL